MTDKELYMRKLVRESDVIDRTDGSELAKAFNYLWDKYIETSDSSTDAISRQAALNCLTATGLKKYDFILNARMKIKALPPVTPMQTEITLESAIDYLHSIGWMQKHDKELTESAPKQRTGHWVKIKPYPLQMHDYECSECGHETDDNMES